MKKPNGTKFAYHELMRHLFLFIYWFSILGCLDLSSLPSPSKNSDLHPESNSQETPPLVIAVLDVGQGDATLMITPSGKTILIDTGPIDNGTSRILPILEEDGIQHLDALFISHFDADHIGGTASLVAGEDGKMSTEDDFLPDVTYDGGDPSTPQGKIFADYLSAVGPTRKTLGAGDHLEMGDGVTLDCLFINGRAANGTVITVDAEDDNAKSMALLISYGSFRYLTAGDAPAEVENIIAPLAGPIDVLHVNHHGSQSSSSVTYLKTLSPQACLISVGNNNNYGLPSQDTLIRLGQQGCALYQTEQGVVPAFPSATLVNGTIFVLVQKTGSFSVNGDHFMTKKE